MKQRDEQDAEKWHMDQLSAEVERHKVTIKRMQAEKEKEKADRSTNVKSFVKSLEDSP